MHWKPSPSSAARRSSQLAIVLWLAALALLGAGCATGGTEGKRGACYDVRGRVEPSIVTKAECEVRDWFWRESP